MRDFGRPIDNIVIHCTATTQGASVDAIINFWKTELKWKNVGYHYIIGVNGERHILAHLSQVTNGVHGYNWNSVHISYIGGKNGIDNRTKAQKLEMERLIRELLSDNILGPNVNIVGHRDLSPDLDGDGIITSKDWIKICPSFEVNDWLKEIKLR